jgi:hypothetical protein
VEGRHQAPGPPRPQGPPPPPRRPPPGDRPRHRGAADCSDLPAIPQTLSLYRYARRHGVTVFFITGRRERAREDTVDNLKAEGYKRWKGLRMRPDDQPLRRKDGWKARMRRNIQRRGYRIVVNVGDQRSDLDAGHALRRFKLPNPMYVIQTA